MMDEYFVAHKYAAEQYEDLREAIETELAGTGLKPIYADRTVKSAHIIEKIQSHVFNTCFGIFDLTGISPNVTLELGMAMASR